MRTWAPLVLLVLCGALFAADTGDEWWKPEYRAAAEDLTVSRLLIGYPDLTVKPYQIASRYEWAGVLSRLVWYYDIDLLGWEKLPEDVPWDHWAADACRVVSASRLYPAPPGTLFKGDDPITRGEFALMAWNLAGALQGIMPPRVIEDIDDPLRVAAADLSTKGILVGYPDGQVHLEREMPRWQVCLAVRRLVAWEKGLAS